ncbi:SDR family NAD(P)-dependent oxidoreductase [Arthrobacter sp. SX1312]|uniref:SDR family NAD(P)-dependent oxidoreductase n=1 Tax=Arthrobacter sp. SX1312 TaxID=2058896 RepID=UPI000CE48803|nr:SDR family NAD(P)-dependent oxidoreductase [Arthrobacter sp. SX1312]
MTIPKPQVVFVTGGSRGVGRGIARAFGEAGATVYVGGRTTTEGTAPSRMPGTIHDTARLVTESGGTGIPLRLDVSDDSQVEAALARIDAEQGRLDVLVNSAWGGYERFTDGSEFNPGPFWHQPLSLWDSMHRTGLRAHYVASSFAAPLLIEAGTGLIVTLSSFAGQVFVPPVPYGVAHAAIDRLAADMAVDLEQHGITSVSLYPGLVLTEGVLANIEHFEHETNRETPLFVGRAVVALAADPHVLRLTGLPLVAAEVARAYGVKDEHGHQPYSNRPAISGEPTPAFPDPFAPPA